MSTSGDVQYIGGISANCTFGEQLQNINAPFISLVRSQMANLFRLTLTIALYLELQA